MSCCQEKQLYLVTCHSHITRADIYCFVCAHFGQRLKPIAKVFNIESDHYYRNKINHLCILITNSQIPVMMLKWIVKVSGEVVLNCHSNPAVYLQTRKKQKGGVRRI